MSQKKLLVTSIFDNEKIEAEEVKKSKIERAFDRLESIADGQKKAIQKLRTALIKNNRDRKINCVKVQKYSEL